MYVIIKFFHHGTLKVINIVQGRKTVKTYILFKFVFLAVLYCDHPD